MDDLKLRVVCLILACVFIFLLNSIFCLLWFAFFGMLDFFTKKIFSILFGAGKGDVVFLTMFRFYFLGAGFLIITFLLWGFFTEQQVVFYDYANFDLFDFSVNVENNVEEDDDFDDDDF